ncbi:flavodoxin [Lachnospiraceae bacterium 54-11]
MRKIVSLLLSFGMIFALAACGQSAASEKQEEIEMETEIPESVSTEEQEADVSTKTLVVYFSCTGTTELVAEYITEILGADSYQIVPENPYTEADLAYYTNGRADQEQDDPDARPAISGGVENMDAYDTIILGYPIWHGQAPRIISTFLESYDFSGKTIVPFCTSHSSGVGSSADNLHSLCAESVEWRDGKRFESGVSKESVQKWIEEIGIE